jgi:hypothetical protein
MATQGHDFANGWQANLQLPTSSSIDATLSRSGAATPTPAASPRSGIVVFSGGSAANNLVEIFNQVREANDTTLSYVIPISDNGGSSSELIRVFGGPGKREPPCLVLNGPSLLKYQVHKTNYHCKGIGDVRSRLVRLIPEANPETAAIKAFFNYRLPKTYGPAREEWLDLVEANHALWHGISSPKRELIRSFLNAINLEMLKRLRPTSRFDFSGASVGNLFLTGYAPFRTLRIHTPGARSQRIKLIDVEIVQGCSRAHLNLRFTCSPVYAASQTTSASCQFLIRTLLLISPQD